MKPTQETVPVFSDSYLHGGITGCCKQIAATWMERYFVHGINVAAVILQQFMHTDVIHFHDIVCHCCSKTCAIGMKFNIHSMACTEKFKTVTNKHKTNTFSFLLEKHF
jgi:hypothetical protein